MRIAAGVLIILVAILDLIVGGGYLLGSAVSNAGGQLANAGLDMQKQLLDQAKANKAPPAQIAAMEKALADAKKNQAQAMGQISGLVKFGSGMMTAFGAYLLLLGCLGIACGVILFLGKAAIFAIVVGVMQLIAEAAGCYNFSYFGLWNAPGVIAAIFVIVAAVAFYPKKRPARYEDEEEEEEEERPRKRRPRDEEEVDEEEEEEEEEERPRVRRPAPPSEGVQQRPPVRRPAPPSQPERPRRPAPPPAEERPRRRPPVDEDEDDDAPPPRRRQ